VRCLALRPVDVQCREAARSCADIYPANPVARPAHSPRQFLHRLQRGFYFRCRIDVTEIEERLGPSIWTVLPSSNAAPASVRL
jgi:hypothetical protein